MNIAEITPTTVARWSVDMDVLNDYYKQIFKNLDDTKMVRRKKKYRSIDDPWEDSSEVKLFDKPKITPRFAKARTLQPVEKYYYNCIVRDESGSMGPVEMQVSPALHKKLMESMMGGVSMSCEGDADGKGQV